MGLQLFVHALRMVFGNLEAALRISALLVAAQIVLAMALGSGGVTAAMLGAIAQIVLGLWIAVAWHRHILLEEQPAGVLPRLDLPALGRYALAALILGVVLMVVAIPFVFLTGIVAMPLAMGGSPVLATIIGFMTLWLPVTYVSLRLAPVLPSAAVGARVPLTEAWYATGTGGAALMNLALICALAGLAVSLPALMVSDGPLAVVLSVIANWLVLMVGTSLMTTIHGHYVQGRPLG